MKKVFSLLIIFLSVFICTKVYAYKIYKVGDEVTYNDIKFYVIKDSSSEEDSVTLLKAEPLTVEEVNLYGGVGTDNNHVNKYTYDSVGIAKNDNGHGGMAYYSSPTCGWINGQTISSGCTNDYETSDAKYLIDSWALAKFKLEDLTIDSTGYSARLITEDDLLNVGYYYNNNELRWENVPEWVHDQFYATMISKYGNGYIKYVDPVGFLNPGNVESIYSYRPVVILKKQAIDKDDDNQDNEIIDDDSKEQSVIDNTVESKQSVTVPNTLKSVSGLIILVGLVLVCAGLNIFIIIKNKDRKKD